MQYLGDYPTSAAVSFLWSTNDNNGAAITRSGDGTLKIFKSNATASTWATERSSLSGVTQLEDFDSTGIHSVYIDTSDNTDAGFYAAGGEYQVAITGATVNGQTVNVPLAAFSIQRAGGVLAYLKAGSTVAASVTGAVGSIASGGIAAASFASGAIDATAIAANAIGASELAADVVTDIWQGTALTEAYAADGAAATPAQLLYMIWSLLAELNQSGTTLTAKKLDGATSAMTFTIDSATAPTTITRAT